MSPILTLLLAASVAGLTVCVGYVNLVRRRPRRIVQTVALTIVALLALRYALSGPDVETKGPAHDAIAIAFCYVSMVLGMMAQYGYRQAQDREFTFDPAAFFMPIFASPIVFIPLLTVIGDVEATGALASSKLMVYLIAFQNGFFWRGFFDAQRLGATPPAGRSEDLPLRRSPT